MMSAFAARYGRPSLELWSPTEDLEESAPLDWAGEEFGCCSSCGGLFRLSDLEGHQERCGLLTANSRDLDATQTLPVRKGAASSSSASSSQSRKGLASSSSVSSAGSMPSERPGTTTLSEGGDRGKKKKKRAKGEAPTPPGAKPCFVCGQRFGKGSLHIHEKKCLGFWDMQVSALPKTLSAGIRPVRSAIPSVDGTIDEAYEEAATLRSAASAQRVLCSKCKSPDVPLDGAKEHAADCRGRKTPAPEANFQHGAALFKTLY